MIQMLLGFNFGWSAAFGKGHHYSNVLFLYIFLLDASHYDSRFLLTLSRLKDVPNFFSHLLKKELK